VVFCQVLGPSVTAFSTQMPDEKGEKVTLKPGAEVDVVLETDSDATMKKPS